MSTIGIYDADFMHYENVIPNLECMKLYSYYLNHNDIVVLAPKLEPERYTRMYVRKDYNDQEYQKEYFADNVLYGGRAFTPQLYFPLGREIESSIADPAIYDKYKLYYGRGKDEKAQIKHLLNCAHARLQSFGNPFTMEQLDKQMIFQPSGLILHDYDLAAVPNATAIIKDISKSHIYHLEPLRVGNKFPISIYNYGQLEQWAAIDAMPTFLNIQYHGIMDEETTIFLSTTSKRLWGQIIYDVTYDCADEASFVVTAAPQIFKTATFLRSQEIKISLKYDERKFVTKELRTFIDLLNIWLHYGKFDKTKQTLYNFVWHYKQSQFRYPRKRSVFNPYRKQNIDLQDIRDMFTYFRMYNYAVFEMFYHLGRASVEGGKINYEWIRNKEEN